MMVRLFITMFQGGELISKFKEIDFSIIIPTYNESENILNLIDAIKCNLPDNINAEVIIVDDNSPDGTGSIVEDYIRTCENPGYSGCSYLGSSGNESTATGDFESRIFRLRVVHRKIKFGLIPAILNGISASTGKYILIMDADFSHPPETIPILIRELIRDPDSIVVASRYMLGSSIKGWPYKRRLLSTSAVKIAKHSLRIGNISDPISGFFAISRNVVENVNIDSMGYKILLEILVKVKGVRVKEIPYTFVDRRSGTSKLDLSVALDYIRSVWRLYRYGQQSRPKQKSDTEKRSSVRFLSKVGRFYTVGATGLVINFLISYVLSNSITNMWYIHATTVGIAISVTTNFVLNKIWTFEDKQFQLGSTLRQYGLFASISALGAALQLGLLYIFVQSGIQFGLSLIFAVALASANNFLLNKKFTFHEKIWD
ncbi:MAG TPA: glycosyltransferase family 2 protein [Nitrososphaeraceae archaeon]